MKVSSAAGFEVGVVVLVVIAVAVADVVFVCRLSRFCVKVNSTETVQLGAPNFPRVEPTNNDAARDQHTHAR